MFSGNGRAFNRLVVGRGTEAGSGGSMPHSRFWRGVSMRVRLLAGLGLAALLLAVVAALPLRAQTPTEVTLVSNLHTGASNDDNSRIRQPFRTGAGSSDHTILAVLLTLGNAGGGRAIRVELRENGTNTNPGTLVATLSNPTTLASNSVNRFTAPAGTTLSPNTRYWLDVNRDIASKVWLDRTIADDETSESGWTIGNGYVSETTSGNWAQFTTSLRFSIIGPYISSNDATLSDLSLEDASNGSAITLDPAFSAGEFDYSASVEFPVSRITVLPTTNDAGASIRYLNDIDEELGVGDRFLILPAEGEQHFIKVEVTAEDGTATETYTLTVTRAGRPGEVLLSERVLSVTEGGGSAYYSVVLNRQPAANVTVTIGGHGDTNVTPNPTNLTFTTSNWQQLQWVFVSTVSDGNTTNESVRLTHTATSSDDLFDDITIPDLVVNVDDADAPDYHIRTITVPQGSHALAPRSLAGKSLVGFLATPSRRITALYGMVMYAIRATNPLLHR